MKETTQRKDQDGMRVHVRTSGVYGQGGDVSGVEVEGGQLVEGNRSSLLISSLRSGSENEKSWEGER